MGDKLNDTAVIISTEYSPPKLQYPSFYGGQTMGGVKFVSSLRVRSFPIHWKVIALTNNGLAVTNKHNTTPHNAYKSPAFRSTLPMGSEFRSFCRLCTVQAPVHLVNSRHVTHTTHRQLAVVRRHPNIA